MVEVKVREVTLLLEEKLLFKVLQWAGVGGGPTHQEEGEQNEIMDMLTHRYTTCLLLLSYLSTGYDDVYDPNITLTTNASM